MAWKLRKSYGGEVETKSTNLKTQRSFMQEKNTTGAIFAFKIFDKKELHCVFVYLDKAYYRVPREKLGIVYEMHPRSE